MGRVRALSVIALALAVAACGKGNKAADALDNAAAQSEPAAATELHNQADEIRNSGSDDDVAAPNSSAQNAMQSAGDAASANPKNEARPKPK